MIAAEIPAAYLAPMLAVSFTTVIALIGWIAQTLWKINTALAGVQERSADHERRLDHLELESHGRRLSTLESRPPRRSTDPPDFNATE